MGRKKIDNKKRHVQLSLSFPPAECAMIEADRAELGLSRSQFFLKIYQAWKADQWMAEIQNTYKINGDKND